MGEDALAFLANSEVRPAVLTVLREHGPLSVRDLDDRLTVSRRTLKRTISEMSERGWVRPDGGAYEFTALGDAILSAYKTFRERERVAHRCRSFLEHTPSNQFDAGIDALADATVVDSDVVSTAPVDRVVELRDDATRLRQYAPFLLVDSVQQLTDRATGESPLDATLVLKRATPPDATDEYRERFEALAATPNIDIHIYPDGPPFGLGVADGHAFVGAADTNGMPHALLEGETSPLVAWVDRRLDRYLELSEPFSPP